MDIWYPIQVKQKDKAGRPDIDSFEAVMTREDRTKGFFVAFDFSSDAKREIDAFFRKSGKVIVPLTVKEILDEELAKKLAQTRRNKWPRRRRSAAVLVAKATAPRKRPRS